MNVRVALLQIASQHTKSGQRGVAGCPGIPGQIKSVWVAGSPRNTHQDHHVIALTLAHRANPPSAKATRCDPHNFAEKLNRPNFFPDFDEGEPHRLWPAKKPHGTLLCNALTVTTSPPFLPLPSCLINWVAPVQNWSHCPSRHL